jgi:hypothetical protein
VLVRVKRLHAIQEIQFAFKKFYSHLPVYTSVQIKKHLTSGSYSKVLPPLQSRCPAQKSTFTLKVLYISRFLKLNPPQNSNQMHSLQINGKILTVTKIKSFPKFRKGFVF